MILETHEHRHAAFVTLTYAPEHLPKDQCVHKKHLQNFIKRLRKTLEPRRLRYFAVGEYGSKTMRPHYHCILYGVSPTESDVLQTCWTFGLIHCGTAEAASIQYVSGYVVKSMTKTTDKRLEGKNPEFALMSRKPGLGYGVVPRMVEAYHTAAGQTVLEQEHWIASRIQQEQKKYPLGRYLTEKVVSQLGLTKEERKNHLAKLCRIMYDKKATQTTTEYEKIRKAKVQQQRAQQKKDTL
ncbi:MAG: replication initiator protein [Microvirus sp.]|nr:MAG: replication initiator protein [Microvirus sp.]